MIDENGENLGIVTKQDAINIAQERELDVVLVSPGSNPPVARIVNFAKFKYEKNKKAKKTKNKAVETKEWWFKPNITERDVLVKLEKVKKFVGKDNATAKLTAKFVPRTQYEQMRALMDKIFKIAEEHFKIISEIQREGKNLSILVKAK